MMPRGASGLAARPSVAALVCALFLALPLFSGTASAQIIENRKAIFAALDKVTAKIQKLEAPINTPVKFGTLTIVARICHTRPPTEPPNTTTFVQIDETKLSGKADRVFSGWMFAESPGLNALEHPVYDIWLTDCADPIGSTAAFPASAGGTDAGGAAASEPALPPRRFRPRR
ncbi:MAG: DUF2155 domain-containing protein [Hyphomicrobiaceae bacterium]